jgi:hypothetical protein
MFSFALCFSRKALAAPDPVLSDQAICPDRSDIGMEEAGK